MESVLQKRTTASRVASGQRAEYSSHQESASTGTFSETAASRFVEVQVCSPDSCLSYGTPTSLMEPV